MRPAHPARRDPAVKGAQEVVGLYGDPDTSWGIAVDLGVPRLDPGTVAERLAALCATHTHLGAAPEVELVGEGEWSARRAALAAAGYASAALLRVAVRDDGRRLAVGAHHGAVDGLGLVAVAGVALGQPLRIRARGIGDRPARTGFLRSSVSRLGEALVDPPPRFAGRGEDSPLEDLSELTRPLVERGTAHLAAAAAGVFGGRGHDGLPLLVVGASRRVGTLPEADRQTAYLRLRVPAGAEPRERTPRTRGRGSRTGLSCDVGARHRAPCRPSPAPAAGCHGPAEQPGHDRRAARLDRDVPRLQRPARGRGGAGVHEEHDHPEPADPPGGLHGRRARRASSPTWRGRFFA